MSEQLRPQINHLFARLDAGEVVSHARPLARVVAPAVAAALAGSQLAFDLKQAPDQATRKKVLIRDFLVIGGILAGLAITGKILNKVYGAANHLHLPGLAHSHGKETIKKVLKQANDRVISLFKSPKCDHAGEGVVRLQSMAFGGILGGGLGGILGDGINGEDIKRTSGFKLKEGLFQYIGNITFCTVSILYIGKWSRNLAETYAKSIIKGGGEALKTFMGKTKTLLGSLQEKEMGNLKTIPGAASESFETYWLMAKKDLHPLKHELEHLHEHADKNPAGLTQLIKDFSKLKTEHQGSNTFLEGLQRYLGDEFGDRLATKEGRTLIKEINTELLPKLGKLFKENNKAEATKLFQEFYSKQMLNDLKSVSKNDAQITKIAKERLALSGERMGIAAGLLTGIIGGAFASNAINRGLTTVFNLPEGSEVNGLFNGGEHKSKGWMEGTVGERGIHWWDAILHLDDVPTALYIAGVHSVESFINVLYGISGFLTGTAGTNYSKPQHSSEFYFKGQSNNQSYQPLRRHHQGYSQFHH